MFMHYGKDGDPLAPVASVKLTKNLVGNDYYGCSMYEYYHLA
jgi:hypothetical protein